MPAAATKSALAISCVGFALACTPAVPPTTAPVEAPLAVPALAGARARGADDGIRFERVPPTAGQRWAVSTRAESTTEDGDQVSRYQSDFTVELLAVEGSAPMRARVHFDRNVEIHQEADRPTEIDGKTYVVDAAAPHVRDAAGAQAPESEAQRVLDAFPDIGIRARIDEVLPEAPMAMGDRRDDLAAAIVHVIHPRAWRLLDGAATLVRTEAGNAVFALKLSALSASSGVKMEQTGEAHVRLRDSRLVALTLDGTYEGDTTHGRTNGAFTLRRVVRDL